MNAKEVEYILDAAVSQAFREEYAQYRSLVKARAAVAEAYERLAALERECEGLRADAERWRHLLAVRCIEGYGTIFIDARMYSDEEILDATDAALPPPPAAKGETP